MPTRDRRARHREAVAERVHDADRQHRHAGRHEPVREHEPGAEHKPERTEPERADALSQPPAVRAEEDQRQGEERDADVGDPVRRPEIVEHDRPQRVERADHHEQRATHHQTCDHRSRAQQIEREPVLRRRLARLGDVRTQHDRQRRPASPPRSRGTGPGCRTPARAAPTRPDRRRSRRRRQPAAARGCCRGCAGRALITIRRTAGVAIPTPIPITNRAAMSTDTTSPNAMPEQTDDVEHQSREHQLRGRGRGRRSAPMRSGRRTRPGTRRRRRHRASTPAMPYSSRKSSSTVNITPYPDASRAVIRPNVSTGVRVI